VFAAVISVAQVPANVSPSPQGLPVAVAHAARILPGDVITIRVFGVPDMTQDFRVSDVGTIGLPMIGTVKAQGLTPHELEEKIGAALRDGGFINEPQVSVSAKEMRSAVVSVLGEVGKPGPYPVFSSCRLSDLITTAGGLTPRSGHLVTLTHADQPNVLVRIDLASGSSKDVEVYAGDSVLVSKAGVVYVLGDVGRPAGLVMENDSKMSVLQALALAGGTGKDAGLKGTRIIRKTAEKIEDIPVPLKKILKAEVRDMDLLPGDVLYIPSSRGKEMFWRGAESIMQAATMLAIANP
jgi:polysaccharide export outer membrane protein